MKKHKQQNKVPQSGNGSSVKPAQSLQSSTGAQAQDGDNRSGIPRRRKRFLIPFVLGLILDIYCCYLAVAFYHTYTNERILTILLVHLVAALLGAFSVYIFQGGTSRFYPYAFVSILSVPIFGFFMALQFILAATVKRDLLLYEEYRQHISMGARNIDEDKALADREQYLKESYEIEPIVDSLKDEQDSTQKIGLIKNLGILAGPGSMKALKDLLMNHHMDIRYYAGEQVAEMAETYNIFINQLTQAIKKQPREPALHFELGKLFYEYALSGLFNDTSIPKELARAKDEFEKTIQLDPSQFKAHFLLGEIGYYTGEYDESIEHYRKVLGFFPGDFRAILGTAKCYWQQKDLGELKSCVAEMEKLIENYNGDDRENVKQFIESWKQY